jgi:hypothetical protein
VFWRLLENTSVGRKDGALLATAGNARVVRRLKLHLPHLVPLLVVYVSPRPCCFVPISERFVSKIDVLKFPYRVAQCFHVLFILKISKYIFNNINPVSN